MPSRLVLFSFEHVIREIKKKHNGNKRPYKQDCPPYI